MTDIATSNPVEILPSPMPAGRMQWIHVFPLNPIMTRDGRGPYHVEDPARLISDTLRLKGQARIPVDYDHLTELEPKMPGQGIAAGWVEKFEVRKDGIWALVEWTEKAASHIAAREYRYVSPSFFHDSAGRVRALSSIAVVNKPNLHQLTALNREEKTGMAKRDSDTTDFTYEEMAELKALLELAPNVYPAQVLAKIRVLVGKKKPDKNDEQEEESNNRSQFDPAKFVPIEQFERAVADANALRQGIQQDQAVNYVHDKIKSGQLAPAFREWGISLCTQNKPAFDAFIQKTGPAFRQLFEPIKFGDLPSRHAAENGSEIEDEICQRLGISRKEYDAAR